VRPIVRGNWAREVDLSATKRGRRAKKSEERFDHSDKGHVASEQVRGRRSDSRGTRPEVKKKKKKKQRATQFRKLKRREQRIARTKKYTAGGKVAKGKEKSFGAGGGENRVPASVRQRTEPLKDRGGGGKKGKGRGDVDEP